MAVPKLRFKDENGADYPEWGKKKLRDITFASGKKNKELGNYESYSINNISGFVSQNEQFEAGNYNNADKSLYYIVSPNSFAYNPARINVGSIGYQELGKDVIVSSLYEVFKTKESCEDKFLWYFLKTKYFNDMIYKYAEGGIRQYLFYDNFCRININIPCLKEQQKIADFLTTFDKRITAQQNIIADMEETKKGLLQKIFSQEIRFKDDNGEDYPKWKKKKIKDVALLQRGFDLPKSQIEKGNIPVIGSNGIIAYHNDYKCEGCAVVTGRSGSIGTLTYLDFCKYWPHNTSLWVTNYYNNIPKFIYYLYLNIHLERFSTGTGVPTLNRNDVHNFELYIPSREEQKKIASFLSTYDKKIEAEKKILADLQEMKKGLLQQMFV